MSDTLNIGNAKVTEHRPHCCGKPRGCTMTHEGCAYLRHPWKRAMLFGDMTVQCQATGVDPETNEPTQCQLLNGHEPPCMSTSQSR